MCWTERGLEGGRRGLGVGGGVCGREYISLAVAVLDDGGVVLCARTESDLACSLDLTSCQGNN